MIDPSNTILLISNFSLSPIVTVVSKYLVSKHIVQEEIQLLSVQYFYMLI